MQQKIVSMQQADKKDHGDPESYLKVFAEVTITEVLKENGKVVGAYGYRRENGNELLFESPAVILATGGVGKLLRSPQTPGRAQETDTHWP